MGKRTKKLSKAKRQSKTRSVKAAAEVAVSPSPPKEEEKPLKLEATIIFGTVPEALLTQTYVEYFRQWTESDDRLALRQLASLIIDAIRSKDALSSWRTLANICHRMLESDVIEGEAQVDWKDEFIVALWANAHGIYSLLHGEEVAGAKPFMATYADLLQGVFSFLHPSITHQRNCDPCTAVGSLFSLLFMQSMPSLSFDPQRLYNFSRPLGENLTHDPHASLALWSYKAVETLYEEAKHAVESTLLLDELHAQHTKLFNEIAEAYHLHETMPRPLMAMLRKRIGTCSLYQSLHASLLEGRPLDKELPRRTRLDVHALAQCRGFFHFIHEAVKQKDCAVWTLLY